MQRYILFIIIWLGGSIICIGTPMTIQFSDGSLFRIHKVEVVQESFNVWKENPNPLKQMFFAYNYPDHITQYKNLFYKNGYPWEIENIYDSWRLQMNEVQIETQGIFYGQLEDMEVACIQYSFTEGTNTIQMSFLAKRIDGSWYPLEGKQMAMYQHIMGFFGTLQPELVACFLSSNDNPIYSQAATKLLEQCSIDGHTLTEACIYEMAEQWGSNPEPTLVELESRVFKNRMHQEISEERKTGMHQALEEYVTSLGIPKDGVHRVMYYFSKNESMKAISTMYLYGAAVDKQTLFSTLNQIQQTTQYRLMEQAITEKPKSN